MTFEGSASNMRRARTGALSLMGTALSAATWPATARDLVSLTKPRVTVLVAVTAAGGMWLAPGTANFSRMLLAMVAIATLVGSANALNCYLEREVDAYMRRTAGRPLPQGRLEPRLALGLGLLLAAISLPTLGWLLNPLTGLLGAASLILYVWVYTPMKQRSPAALLVGAVPGAAPPLLGWTAMTGRLDAGALVLFAILFFWQLPHFIAIAVFRREEYERAGIRVLPAVHGERIAKQQAVVFALLLLGVSLLLVPLGVAGSLYLVAAAALGVGFAALCVWWLVKEQTRKHARLAFVGSLGYLTALFAALMMDRWIVG